MTNTQPADPLPVHQPRKETHGRRRPSVLAVIIGVIGELLITAGVLVGLLVVWQIFYTDIIGMREASEHISTFQEEAVPVAATQIATKQQEPAPEEFGEGQFAVLYVPRWGEEYKMPIASGVGPSVINEGYIGHYENTGLPGQIGNFALAGHRQSKGKPFRYVEELRPGDPLIVRTKDRFYVYRVTSDRIVLPTATEVLAPNPLSPGDAPTTAMITLTTCHPLWQISERWITHGELDYWTYASDGRPEDLPEGSL